MGDKTAEVIELEKNLQTLIDSGKANDKQLGDVRAELDATKKALQSVQDFQRTFHLSGKDSGTDRFAGVLGGAIARSMAAKHYNGNLDRVPGYQGEFKEMAEQMHEKAATYNVDADGGLLVPTALLINELVDTFRPSPSTIFDLGARKIDLAPGTGSAVIPVKDSNSTAYALAENGAPTMSALKFSNKQISPKRHAVISSISNRLMFSVPTIMQIWNDDMQREWDIMTQLFALYGTGQSPQPQGLYNTAGKLTVALNTLNGTATDGRTMSYTDIANLEDALLEADAPLSPSYGLLFAPKVLRQLKTERTKLYSGASTLDATMPVLANNAALASISSENIAKAIGYRFAVSTQMVKTRTIGGSSDGTDVFFGDWSQLAVYNFGMRLKTSDTATAGGVSAFESNLTHIMIDGEIDVLVRQPKALVLGTGIRNQ